MDAPPSAKRALSMTRNSRTDDESTDCAERRRRRPTPLHTQRKREHSSNVSVQQLRIHPFPPPFLFRKAIEGSQTVGSSAHLPTHCVQESFDWLTSESAPATRLQLYTETERAELLVLITEPSVWEDDPTVPLPPPCGFVSGTQSDDDGDDEDRVLLLHKVSCIMVAAIISASTVIISSTATTAIQIDQKQPSKQGSRSMDMDMRASTPPLPDASSASSSSSSCRFESDRADDSGASSSHFKKRNSLSTTPSMRRKSSIDEPSDALFHTKQQQQQLHYGDDTSSTSSSTNTDKALFAGDHLPRLNTHDEGDDIAFHHDLTWTSDEGTTTNSSTSPIWTHMLSCVRRCLSASSQPGFFDMNDPARRKHSGVNHLPYRYRSLLLLDEQDHGDGSVAFAAVLGIDNPYTDDESAVNARDDRSFLDKEHMTELTVSLLESTWVFLLLLGLLASLVAWSVDGCVLLVQRLRTDFSDLGGAWVPNYLLYTAYRVFILVLGVACTYFVCPNAAGSGIPEMRSILGGFPFPNYLSKRTLIAKCFGLIFALGSGLSIGKEGPFVHLSCIIAHQLLRVPLFKQIRRSQDLTHHVLAAACAVGVTATFGTPIGGVLFSIEVTTTYYVTSNYWRAFFSSVVGVVVFRMLNSLLTGNTVSLFTTDFEVLPYKSYEITLFLILAAICGILGALFVKTYRTIVVVKEALMERYLFSRWASARAFAPFFYAAFVALVFALVEFPVGSFMQLSQRQMIDDMFSTGNLTSSDPTHLYQDFGRLWTSPSLALNLFSYICVRFFSTAISATVMVPSGIVTPVFAVGAAIGRLFGEMIVFFGGGNELAGGYAVVGAASLTAGVTGTISIAVIVFELTSQLSYMIPVLLCVLVGRSVAAFFSLDMYDTISRQKNLPQWPDLTKQKSYGLIASDLMRGVPAYWVLRHQTLSSLKQLLLETAKEVTLFPIIDDEKTMVYLGAADREELESVVEMWELCLGGFSSSANGKKSTVRDGLASYAEANDDGNIGTITPRSRHIEMTNELALAGLSKFQEAAFSNPATKTSQTIDLVKLELLNLDAGNFHVHRDTFASQVILLISVHKAPELFVTARGKLLGVIHASDLLARSRRFML